MKLTIKPGPSGGEEMWNKSIEYATRFAMMLRRINIQYTTSDGMMLPGFLPEVGDMFGQSRSSIGMAPGLGFAFGGVSRSYIDYANDRGWLITNDSTNITPAMISNARNLNIECQPG